MATGNATPVESFVTSNESREPSSRGSSHGLSIKNAESETGVHFSAKFLRSIYTSLLCRSQYIAHKFREWKKTQKSFCVFASTAALAAHAVTLQLNAISKKKQK